MTFLVKALRRAKHALADLGAKHPLVLSVLWAYGLANGYRVVPITGRTVLRRGDQVMILRDADFTFTEYMIQRAFGMYFGIVEPRRIGADQVLDFSRPALHRYPQRGLEFSFPGIPEDDDVEAYTSRFEPTEGMVVFDAGAHAGFTTYFFSRMVGETGAVYAFEPDRRARACLEENVRRLGLTNVFVLEAALGGESGRSLFNMDGSVSAGLVEHLANPDTGFHERVEVLTLEDACRQIARVPDFVKMDVEGAEVVVIASSREFLESNPIAFAIASYHVGANGEQTYHALEPALRSIGYAVESSDEFGYMLTWATPSEAARSRAEVARVDRERALRQAG